jgi:hypothetical protein
MKPPSTLRLFLNGSRAAARVSSDQPHRLPRPFLLPPVFIVAALCLSTGFSADTVVYQAGGGLGVSGVTDADANDACTTFWNGTTINWAEIGGTDISGDAYKSLTPMPEFDYVGKISYAQTSKYVYFRMCVNATAATFGTTRTTSPNGSYFVLIDIAGQGVTGIDYAMAWDSYNGSRTFDAQHGLEMTVRNEGGLLTSKWYETKLNDLDGSDSEKKANDINGLSSVNATEGYVRTTSVEATSTTFIDFAVAWNYMEASENGTSLMKGQTWNVTAANLYNTDVGSPTNDHQKITGDVYGIGATTSSTLLSSASWATVPEPSSALAGLLLGAGLLRRRRKLAPL